jgi:outer membrane receptor for ferrienterochelin and colicins
MNVVPLLIASALAAALVCPAVALGDSNADEAEVRFRRATSMYKAGHYEEALTEFFASNRLAPNRNVVFNIARCYEALQRHEEAYRYYAEYRASEPAADEQAAIDRKLAELRPRVALIRVDSDPPGATVYLDRKDLGGRGETPLVLAYPPGQHAVIVERAGYHPATTQVTMTRGKEVAVALPLSLITGQVTVRSRPAGAVFVDRAAGDSRPAAAESTPATLTLTPGRHAIEVVAPDHRTRRVDVVVRAGAVTPVEVELEKQPPPSGTVVLRASVPGALVRVDGVERGFTPVVLSLLVGRHVVEVESPRHATWRRELTVERDGREFHEIVLVEREAEVVGATRTTQALSRAPAAVTLIDRAELRAFGYRTLAGALGAVRGLYFSDDLNYEAVGVRGFSRPGDYTNRILVTRDGHAMNDDWIGSAAVGRDFAPDLEDVERIEVIRGPGSTFYGAGAFFGVVNVVSRPAGSGPPVRAGGELDSEGGGSAFAHGQQRGRLGSVTLHASSYASDGRELQFEEFADTPSGGAVRGSDGEAAQRAALRAQLGDVTLHCGYARRRKDLPTAPFATVFDPGNNEATGGALARTTDRRGFAEAIYDRSRGRVRLTARLAYDHQRYDGVYPYDDPELDDDAFVFTDRGGGDWITGEARVGIELGPQHLTLGAEGVRHRITQGYDEDDDGSDEFDDRHRYVSGSLYLVDRIALGQRAELTAGLRLDRFGAQQDSALSPRLALVATPYAGGASKLVVGRAFRSPSIFELYYNDGGITQLPPDSLEPEIVWSGEVEHVHGLGKNAYLLASLFGNRITGLIIDPEDDEGLIQYANSADPVVAYGGELEARLSASGGAWIAAALSATRIATDEASARINSAPVVGALRALWPAGDELVVAGELVYNAPRRRLGGGRTEHAAVASLHATHRLGTSDLLLRAGIHNLLDVDWSVAVGEEFEQRAIRQRGRTFALQVIYEGP